MILYVINAWLSYKLIAHRSKESWFASKQRPGISLFCTMSRWSRNHPASYAMGSRGKSAAVWNGLFTSICSQDYECIQLHCHHSTYIFVVACQWFYHWFAISTVQFLVWVLHCWLVVYWNIPNPICYRSGQVYFLLPYLLVQTHIDMGHLGILHCLDWWTVTNILEECTAFLFTF